MVERVGDDRIFGPQRWFEEPAIGIEGSRKKDGVIRAKKRGEAGFEHAVQSLHGHALAFGVNCRLGRFDQRFLAHRLIPSRPCARPRRVRSERTERCLNVVEKCGQSSLSEEDCGQDARGVTSHGSCK